jgi:predicted nucleotidyltransferase
MEGFSFRHRLVIRLLGIFPQILLVALCNSRAMGEADENSDIDLFIIAKKGNLWTARFFTTIITLIFGLRRRNTHGLEKWTPEYIKRTKDRFCLSFFITEEAMNLDSIRLQPDDPYLDRWIATLIPIVNKRGFFERFMEVNGFLDFVIQVNILREASTIIQKNNDSIIRLDSVLDIPFRDISHFSLTQSMEKLARNDGSTSFFESLIRRMWLPKTLRSYQKLGKPWWVVISDTMLKFHDQDVRREYIDPQM